MFSVLFEVQPQKERRASYLANEKMLRPELEQLPGFIDSSLYRSLTRDGWILSLSHWDDEASVANWRERMRRQEVKERGWNQILDYRLRVGEVMSDTQNPEDRAAVGLGPEAGEPDASPYVTLVNAKQTPDWAAANNPQEMALYLGFDLNSFGDCISWDILDAVYSPGEIILVVSWKDSRSASDHAATQMVPEDARLRVVRVTRDCATSDQPGSERYRQDAEPRDPIRA